VSKKIEFLTQLSALLKEYNVSIEADVADGSDTHGIFGRTLKIIHTESNSFRHTRWFSEEGWFLSASEIDEQLGI